MNNKYLLRNRYPLEMGWINYLGEFLVHKRLDERCGDTSRFLYRLKNSEYSRFFGAYFPLLELSIGHLGNFGEDIRTCYLPGWKRKSLEDRIDASIKKYSAVLEEYRKYAHPRKRNISDFLSDRDFENN